MQEKKKIYNLILFKHFMSDLKFYIRSFEIKVNFLMLPKKMPKMATK